MRRVSDDSPLPSASAKQNTVTTLTAPTKSPALKMPTRSRARVIRSAATPGVPITLTHRPPAEIPVRSGVTYFNLNLQNDYWKAILQDRLISIYLPPPFDPERVKLELLAIPRQG